MAYESGKFATHDDIERAQNRVRSAFTHLVMTQFALNEGCCAGAQWCKYCKD
jgi:hypothetical protein